MARHAYTYRGARRNAVLRGKPKRVWERVAGTYKPVQARGKSYPVARTEWTTESDERRMAAAQAKRDRRCANRVALAKAGDAK